MIKNSIIRLAESKDKDNILHLLNTVFNEQQRSSLERGDEFWDWKFQNSPYGKSILTVVEYMNEIVAVSNLWPWVFHCRGQILKALQPSDSAVHPDFRSQGLFKATRIFGLETANNYNYQIIFNFPNKNSLPAYRSLGWHYLGLIPWWVRILKPLNILKGKILDSKAKPLQIDDEYLLDTGLLHSIENESKSFDGYLKIHRVSGYFNWRYLDRSNRMYGMVIYELRNKRTAAIFTLNQKGPNKEMVVIDLIGSNVNTISIFKKIRKIANYLDADFIAVMHNSRFYTDQLWRLGYVKKRFKNMVVLPIDISLENKITDFKNWSMMAGMHDSI